jgi:LmbE family N-acetylglucosaminyl deacetylase
MKEKIIVVAVHPDDETIGAGGSLLRFKAEGKEIYWMVLTNIHVQHGFRAEDVETRSKEITEVSKLYNFNDTFLLDFPTTQLDSLPKGEIISAISKVFRTVNPTTVILPFLGDVHGDHRTGFECAYTCTKNFRYPSIKKIWMMETSSETDFALPGQHNTFSPNVFIEISDFIQKKEEIFSLFKSEIGQHPFPRSIENLYALATVRGATAGVKYAEGFMNIKTVL